MKDEITIQRAWLQGLLRDARKINEFSGEYMNLRECWIAHLLGYIQSAEYMLESHDKI